jgi:chromosome segregation ATPase
MRSPKPSPVSGRHAIKASEPKIPPRVRPPEKGPRKLSATFVNARQLIDDVLGEQNTRVTELLLNANHGLSESLSRFQESCTFVRAVLERNEDLAREAERLGTEGEHLNKQQDSLEADVRRLASHNRELADRVNSLRREHSRLQDESGIMDDAQRDLTEDLSKERGTFELLKAKTQKAEDELSQLRRERTSTEKHLAELQRVREDYLRHVQSAKKAVADLTDGD